MIKILQGDWIERLRELPDASVHCCVTSPPYWGLRDYGIAGQLGLERSPKEYVAKLVEGFREVRRVLRDDASLWLNLGDSYASDWNSRRAEGGGGFKDVPRERIKERPPGLKPKDLCGIPWRVAFALQADGWFLRSAIPWLKRNSMPESVTDRPSSAVEMIFLLSKSERYFFDSQAIRVGYKRESLSRYDSPMMGTAPTGRQPNGDADRRIRDKGQRDPNPNGRQRRNSDWWFEIWQGLYSEGEELLGFVVNPACYKDAHFATYPPDLVKPCILAGTSAKGCCPKCGAPWERMVETVNHGKVDYNGKHLASDPSAAGRNMLASVRGARMAGGDHDNPFPPKQTLGWQPTCECGESSTVPCTVLDPFAGSGTTGLVAIELARKALLIELNPDYCRLIEQRTRVTPGLPLC